MSRVVTGLERVLDDRLDALVGKRVGLLANPTTVDANLRHAVDLFAAHPDIDLRVLLGPEHGLRGDAQDMISVDDARDPATGLPVYSLYGTDEASLTPPPQSLADLDVVVFDIQDVGSRYYTYVWTMVLAMRACAAAGVGFVVLDRPNPIGGHLVEGGEIEPPCLSFVGLRSLPVRHGLTAGEIARWAADEEKLDLALEIIPMQGWRREMYYEDTGLPWVMPSPNMPTRDTALVYPGMCLIEGTELSEGRGTTRPFELAGAPFIDGVRLAGALNTLPGLVARPVVFTPMFQKHARTPCGGVQLHVRDRDAYRPYLTGVAFLHAAYAHWPEAFAWRRRAYEFVSDIPAIDLLTGSAAVRDGIEAGASLDDLAATWREPESAFRARREAWLLY
ncbi:exo-beta-N-acetylmuramidase NamZ family protein [Haliangium ochraceum]|uniref:DUF1343 domain-containing protein n=1 Tax=Haliangium ochraceum (strain DSM 14365 / JCM 11303 / SMP-2) TaxID=502025 RepID=D0LY67_HALO1|nr:DUF1343 domain-containing protein [Haliangium ochraceum]ACY16217.1 conserved hypothetical protein [Haliangium ochraceum DSM 14365]